MDNDDTQIVNVSLEEVTMVLYMMTFLWVIYNEGISSLLETTMVGTATNKVKRHTNNVLIVGVNPVQKLT